MDQLNVLIIEKNQLVIQEIENVIQQRDYIHNISIANNKDQAFEEISLYVPDLIIGDISIEDKYDGIEIVEKSRSLNKNVKTIYFTDDTDQETMQKAINTRPVGYLLKSSITSRLEAILGIIEVQKSNVN